MIIYYFNNVANMHPVYFPIIVCGNVSAFFPPLINAMSGVLSNYVSSSVSLCFGAVRHIPSWLC